MKKIFTLVSCAFLIFSCTAAARDIPAFVSAEWLNENLGASNLVVLDIRSSDLYGKSHIPGAVHSPFSEWSVNKENIMMELPSDTALRALLGKLGLSPDSLVVVVNKTDTEWNRADATRVAWTCIAAGIKNASVLDGGFNQWLKLQLPTTREITLPKSGVFDHPINRRLVISKEELTRKIGKSVIIDTRIPEEYFGLEKGQGHIPSALDLPAPWIYNDEGLLRSVSELKAMAAGVIGPDTRKEVIVYCLVGGYSATWSFLLTEVLGYTNVRLYDGSFQEWSQDPKAPISTFRWN